MGMTKLFVANLYHMKKSGDKGIQGTLFMDHYGQHFLVFF